MTDHFSTMIKLALEYFCVAVFLLFVIQFFSIKNNYADVLNERQDVSNSMKEFLEFDRFNNAILTGDQVIEAIRNYKDGRIEICVLNERGNIVKWLTSEDNDITNHADFSVEELGRCINMTDTYESCLVYDFKDASLATVNSTGSEISGIKFTKL